MAEVVQDTEQEFWRSPTVLGPLTEAALPPASFAPEATEMAEACAECGTEFMIGARFCHTCARRPPALTSDTEPPPAAARPRPPPLPPPLPPPPSPPPP